jgi:uncharacterized membrane protein YphA (DoxX/SURF4 family)
MEYLGLAGRLVIGLVFLVAAVPKLRDPAAFRRSVDAYKILPASWVGPVARALPPLEIAIGVMLVTGILIVPVSVLAAVVLVAFGASIWYAVERGSKIGCGCGFRGLQQVSRKLVARNAALTVAAAAAAVWPSGALALFPGPGVPESSIATTDAWAVVVAVVAAYGVTMVALELRRFIGSSSATASAV